MTHHKPHTANPSSDSAAQPPAAGVALILSGAIFLVAEFIAAAAWSDPAYSYTHHFISNLGVRGPSEAFGQFMYSPLAWVMNSGFFMFGLAAFIGVMLLKGLSRWRRLAMLATSGMVAIGGVLLALFPGSGESMDDGTGDYHSIGAFAAIVGGNVLAILLGRAEQSLGLSRKVGRSLVVLGALGLGMLIAFVAILAAGGDILIGLAERGAVYSYLFAFIGAGLAILKRPSLKL